MIGIYGQNEEEAVYFSYQSDKDGHPLEGSKTYTLSFKQPPPVSQFWSLTMYNLPQRWLVDNSINRYSIGDRTEGLIADDGGGLTITLSAKDPRHRQELASDASGPFFMVLRMYGPEKSIIKGEWPRPEPDAVN